MAPKREKAPPVEVSASLKAQIARLVDLAKQLEVITAIRKEYNELRLSVLEQMVDVKASVVKVGDFVDGENKTVTYRKKKCVENPKKPDLQERVAELLRDIDSSITEEQAEHVITKLFEPISVSENYVLSINGPKKRKAKDQITPDSETVSDVVQV